jgi:hypothetical protein
MVEISVGKVLGLGLTLYMLGSTLHRSWRNRETESSKVICVSPCRDDNDLHGPGSEFSSRSVHHHHS